MRDNVIFSYKSVAIFAPNDLELRAKCVCNEKVNV